MVVRKAEPLAIECVVRGYLAGSGWKEYQLHQTVCGLNLPEGLKFLTQESFEVARAFPPDMSPLDVDPNTMQTHALMRYYLDGWAKWFR